MARNEEKSQSMLYRFREMKAIEMGMVNRTDRRPRLASQCTDLRQAERWRGELLREVSRKVSKIQDVNLTDYEVRDLNDEINKLLREKYHWENQIINLGGANYRRAAPKVTMDDGTEVPSMRGYKYFGRARELPGVKELFEQRVEEAKQIAQLKEKKISVFSNQPKSYYGDEDENDDVLTSYERELEEEEWEEQWANTQKLLGPNNPLAEQPPCPKPHFISYAQLAAPTHAPPLTGDKRKADDSESADADAQPSKKSKDAQGNAQTNATNEPGIMTVLDVEDLRPHVPDQAEVERAILQRQKADLLAEFAR